MLILSTHCIGEQIAGATRPVTALQLFVYIYAAIITMAVIKAIICLLLERYNSIYNSIERKRQQQ